MTDARWLTDAEQRTWQHLLWVTRLLQEGLDRQLQRDSGMPHTYYVILAMLSEAPGRTLAMGELAALVRSSASRLSHAVTRLESAGWIRRHKRPGDRRTTLAKLTDEGYAAVAQAAPGHAAAVRRLVFDRLTPTEVRTLEHALAAIHGGLDPDSARRVDG